MTAADVSVERVRAYVESYPGLFGPDHRVIEVPDRIAADRGTHVPGETLFVARIVDETAEAVELADVYRVRSSVSTDDDLYFVAKAWSDARLPASEVRIYR